MKNKPALLRYILRQIKIALLAVVGGALLFASSASAQTVSWNVGDGAWDYVTGNWADGALFENGDAVNFSAATNVSSRSRINIITVDAGGVSPGVVTASGGYSARFEFYGGDILTGSFTTTTAENEIRFYRDGSYSFDGGINSVGVVTYAPQLSTANQTLQLGTGDITTGGFYFFPTESGTKLNNTIYLTGRPGNTNATFWSGANADWSETTVYVTGDNPIDFGRDASAPAGAPAFVTNNLTLTLQDNATFRMNTRTLTNPPNTPAPLTAVVTGDYILTTEVGTGYQGYSIISGDGHWDIAGLTKTGAGVLYANAPEVFGDTLRIVEGRIRLGTGFDQTVTELWLGDTQMTIVGTYGATGSGADFINDTYFQGAAGYYGVLTLIPEPSAVALVSGVGLVLLLRRLLLRQKQV
jgi:hypothetical protein